MLNELYPDKTNNNKKMNCDTFFPPKMLNEFW